MDQGTVAEAYHRGRRLVARPRLVRLLNESDARIALLTAPAGYGKTTLARQWVAARRGPTVWYRATPASRDIAALASGLVQAFTEVIESIGDRTNDLLRTTTDPNADSNRLAELLSQDIASVSGDVTLVIDDYQNIAQSEAAERLVAGVLDRTTIPVLITTRVRPSWASARDILYGQILELGRNVLAMTHEEAQAVLEHGRHEHGLSGLVALAEGWPAVIGLAALLPAPTQISIQTLPASLYTYFAEELYQGMPCELQWRVAQLSIAPSVTLDLARVLFGSSATAVLDEAKKRGFLTEEARGRSWSYELHPLLRHFLRQKLHESDESEVHETAAAIGNWCLKTGDWDAAFALASEFKLLDLLRRLVESGIDSILAEGRLSTLDQWIELGQRLVPADPAIRLAEVEATFRRGKWRDAEAKAIRLVNDLPKAHHLGARVLFRAGQIAQLDDRHSEALSLLTRASRRAQTPSDSRRAIWERFITLSDLEEPALAWKTLLELEQLPPATVEDLVRASQGRLHWAIRWGGIEGELVQQGESIRLIAQVPDPVVRTGFLQTYATALSLAARYAEALEIAERQLREAETTGLEWVRPHALEVKGVAELGLRNFDAALSALKEAYTLASVQANLHSQMHSVLLTARVFLSRSEMKRAKQALSVDWDRKASKGMEGEYLATKALVLACCADHREARHALAASEAITNQIDGRVLRYFVRAIIAHREGADDANHLLEESTREANSSGNLDAFVSAYRAEPSLLKRLGTLDSAETTALRRVVCVTDPNLAEKAGFEVSRGPMRDGPERLTRRERDVLDLLRQGLTNREIAQTFWIEETTVKVHVRNILRKLGVRSRTEAATR
jgi:ATP/maltotriose-dependent transcriptional regulator MalT